MGIEISYIPNTEDKLCNVMMFTDLEPNLKIQTDKKRHLKAIKIIFNFGIFFLLLNKSEKFFEIQFFPTKSNFQLPFVILIAHKNFQFSHKHHMSQLTFKSGI